MVAHIAAKLSPHEREIRRGSGYKSPLTIFDMSLSEALREAGKPDLAQNRYDLFGSKSTSQKDLTIFGSGDRTLLTRPTVAIVGTRQVSDEGYRRARKLARELADAGVVTISGLAKGVDTAAHTGAIDYGGRTISVIGTPLDKAYPAENARLQEDIWRNHLLLSPFRIGEAVFKGNFPKRNRVMAALSSATVIIEASDTSGTLHQAAECQALGRWLFIAQSVVEDRSLTWPSKFLGKENVCVLTATKDIVDRISEYTK